MIMCDDIMVVIFVLFVEFVYFVEIIEQQKIVEFVYEFISLDYFEFVLVIEGWIGVLLWESDVFDIEIFIIGDFVSWVEGEVRKVGVV